MPGTERGCGSDVGRCRPGREICGDDGRFGMCTGALEPAEETCDETDEDCDGALDEGLDCACEAGATRPCGSDVGECAPGTQRCDGSTWSACEGAVAASPERCDGADNDCDGQIDETQGRTECGLGACAVVTDNCVDGVTRPCAPALENAEDEVCNGIDDDCDGGIDEGLSMRVRCGEGACAREIDTCVDGVAIDCAPGAPGEELCGPVDDDCDGQIDEGLDAPVSCGRGACRREVPGCVDGQVIECVPGEPEAEACNAVDDDCDGEVDELPATPTRCGTGRCVGEGERRCIGGVEIDDCADDPAAARAEVCDGIDDDCDGRADELTPEPMTCGQGVCQAAGQRVCRGQWVEECDPQLDRAGDERCNGLDDDCDGRVDELAPRPARCGVGECQSDGEERCVDGRWVSDCTPGAPTAEACSGRDEDCDGRVDERLDRAVRCGFGVCGPERRQQCVAGAWDPPCPPAGGGEAESCNAIDDDCDGRVDERGACWTMQTIGGRTAEAHIDLETRGMSEQADTIFVVSDRGWAATQRALADWRVWPVDALSGSVSVGVSRQITSRFAGSVAGEPLWSYAARYNSDDPNLVTAGQSEAVGLPAVFPDDTVFVARTDAGPRIVVGSRFEPPQPWGPDADVVGLFATSAFRQHYVAYVVEAADGARRISMHRWPDAEPIVDGYPLLAGDVLGIGADDEHLWMLYQIDEGLRMISFGLDDGLYTGFYRDLPGVDGDLASDGRAVCAVVTGPDGDVVHVASAENDWWPEAVAPGSVCRISPGYGGPILAVIAPGGTVRVGWETGHAAGECARTPAGSVRGVGRRLRLNAEVLFDDEEGNCLTGGAWEDSAFSLHVHAAAQVSVVTDPAFEGGTPPQPWIRAVCDAPATELACDNPSFGDLHAEIDWRAEAGQTVLWLSSQLISEAMVRISPLGPAGTCAAPVELDDAGRFIVDTAAGVDTHQGSCAGRSTEAVFRFVPPVAGRYCAHTFGTPFDTALWASRGGCPGAEIACNDDRDGGTLRSALAFEAEAGEPIHLFIDGFNADDHGPATLEIMAGECP